MLQFEYVVGNPGWISGRTFGAKYVVPRKHLHPVTPVTHDDESITCREIHC
jgi:hypothetical protein